MAKLIKCPRCQSLIDVTNLSPGNTVRCPDCGGMARIPTGQTGMQPRVPTPAPQPAAAAPAREGTRMHRRGAAGGRERGTAVVRRSGNTGMIIGITIAAVAVVGLLVVLMVTRPKDSPTAKKKVGAPVPEAPAPEPASPQPAAPAPEAPKPTPEEIAAMGAQDAAAADWNNIMTYLRSGGAFDDETRAEGVMFRKVKRMGKAAYPHLVKYIDHEELPLARAAATVLNELTGQQKPLPNATTRAQVKADWEAWIKANP